MAMNPLDHVLDHPLYHGAPVSKYQVLIVAAAVLVAIVFIPLARRVENGQPPRGAFWNFLEMLLLFIRDEVARPNIKSSDHHGHGDHGHADHGHGHGHDEKHHNPHWQADRYLPFLWTLFLFILACNLLGMVPFLGAPTADLGVTLALAGMVFVVIHVSALVKLGPGGYVMSYIPRLKADNLPMNIFLVVFITPLIAVIEVLGAVIRAVILAIRLFANIFAGHVALGVILLFAAGASQEAIHVFGGVSAATVLMGTALSLLELFVAFLQAFVFVLLTSIFLGMQMNPEH